MGRFAGGKGPFLRISNQKDKNTNAIMMNFIIALIPVILFAWYKNGILVYLDGNTNIFGMLWPLLFVLIGALSSLVMEIIFFYWSDKKARKLKPLLLKLKLSYGIIPGIILTLMLPFNTPIWVIIFGTFISNIIGKMIFGGFGYNVFNPALLGYAVIKFTLMGVILAAGGYMNGSEILIDSYAGATPLSYLSVNPILTYSNVVAPYGNLWNFFFGLTPGGFGETSVLVMLVSFAYLSYKKVIRWQTPTLYVGSVFILSWIVGILNGQPEIWFPLYTILSGGVVFGAVFMITEPVTTPSNPLGKTVFVLYLAVFTILFRYVGNLPEGVGTSIILMNIFTMPIDTYTAAIRANRWKKPVWNRIGVLFGILLILAVFTIFKAGGAF